MTVMQFSMCGGGGRSPCREKNVQWCFRDPPVLYQGFARKTLVLKRTVVGRIPSRKLQSRDTVPFFSNNRILGLSHIFLLSPHQSYTSHTVTEFPFMKRSVTQRHINLLIKYWENCRKRIRSTQNNEPLQNSSNIVQRAMCYIYL